MERKPSFKFRLLHLRIMVAVLLCAAGGWMAMQSFAAEPESGTLSEATPVLNYSAGPFLVSNPLPVPVAQSNPTCDVANPCDSYKLTISNPPAYAAANPGAAAKFTMSWTDTGSGSSDYDFYVYKGEVDTTDDSTEPYARGPGQGNPEVASIFPLEPGDNVYTLKIVPYTASGETVNVKIELLAGSGGPSGGFPGFGDPDPTVPGNPRYQTYYPPKGSSAEASQGEMNIGFNPHTGRFLLNNIGPVWRVTPPELATPGAPECCEALWEERNSIIADQGVDPILWTDQPTGRTFVSNFTGGPNGLYAYTDSDGEPTATQPTGYVVVGAGLPTGGADHQTIGSGPYPAALKPVFTNPINKGQAVYYCTQGLVGPGFCQRSDDLGQSYGPGTLAYSGSNCSGLHGHIRVGPDGAAYLPVPKCEDENGVPSAGLAVSTDGGITWKEFFLPNSRPEGAGSDSSIAIDKDNRLYYFYIVESEDKKRGTMHVQTGDRVFDNVGNLVDIVWSNDTDLGASHGVLHSAFPEAIAGDAGRAAVGFIGSDREGDFQSVNYPGYWYAFMSTTFDGGKTWVTTNVSPNDPVQGKGGVWQQGGSAVNRNLLDFNEITIDDKGRPVYGYDDGCVGDCVGDPDKNSFVAHMRMARQSGGKTLFAAFDPVEPAVAKAACLSGIRYPDIANLRWRAPDNGGADIVRYQIFRGTSPGGGTLIGETVDAVPRFDDYNADPAVEHYYYTVKAVNSQGIGAVSNEIDLTVTPRPPVENLCILPGLTKLTDAEHDSLGGPGTDLKSFQIGQPFEENGEVKIAFTINTDPGLPAQPPGSFWYVAMRVISGQDVTYRGVRMVYNGATPTFQSYTPEPGSSGTVDGRFVEAGSEKPADPSSSYAAPYDKVVIVVKASDLGFAPGTTIAGFISGVAQSAEVAAALYDQMPNSLNYEGTYTVANASACSGLGAPAELLNISTRLRVQRDDNVLFGGFIVNGTAPKRVIVRAVGPSLNSNGTPVEGRLNDPVLELYDNSGNLVTSNDNWKDSPERAEIEASTLQPSNDLEPAIVRNLSPGLYTAIVRGKDNSEGIALVEAYSLDPLSNSQLINISSRGLVETGDNVMIGGFINGVSTGNTNVIVRAIGPSLKDRLANAMNDPQLSLHNANGDLMVENDNWKDTQRTDIETTGLQPTEDAEAAILTSLPPSNYTAILRGKDNTTGIAVVEIYKLP